MNADTIREFVRRQPFEPFVIRLSNGETHEVRHPECLLVLKTKVILGYPCLLYTSPSPRDGLLSRMPSSA